jgi:hypothetical protein
MAREAGIAHVALTIRIETSRCARTAGAQRAHGCSLCFASAEPTKPVAPVIKRVPICSCGPFFAQNTQPLPLQGLSSGSAAMSCASNCWYLL